jgi:hypothetical protein
MRFYNMLYFASTRVYSDTANVSTRFLGCIWRSEEQLDIILL